MGTKFVRGHLQCSSMVISQAHFLTLTKENNLKEMYWSCKMQSMIEFMAVVRIIKATSTEDGSRTELN
jgi:hypothetical protein